MSSGLDREVEKLYAARSTRGVEMNSTDENLLHCMNSQSIEVKIERLVTKRNEVLCVVDKNEDLIMFAGKKRTSLIRVLHGGNDI